jgi:hypothetical protein
VIVNDLYNIFKNLLKKKLRIEMKFVGHVGHKTTQRYNPEDSHLHTQRRENLKSYM